MNRQSIVPDENRFPRDGSSREKLAFILNYAVLAPSVRNTQPWLFSLDDSTISLRADPSRGLPVADPQQRELILSCGAALEHLVVALRHFGYRPEVTSPPPGGDQRTLATLRIGGSEEETTGNAMHFYALHRRVTDRRAYRKRPVSGEVQGELAEEAAGESTVLKTYDAADAKAAIADLVAESLQTQAADPAFRQEWERWITGNGDPRRDGLPASVRGLGSLASIAEQFLGRKVDLSAQRISAERKLSAHSPLLAVLCSRQDTPAGWLEAGRGLARLLLRGRAAGLFASFFSAPVQVPAVRAKLARFVGDGLHPVVVLRMGYSAQPDAATPRRALAEVMQAG